MQDSFVVMLLGLNQHLTSTWVCLVQATFQFSLLVTQSEGKHFFSGTSPPSGEV